MSSDDTNVNKIDFFSVLTDWFEKLIISVDKSGLGDENYTGSFVKYCKKHAESCLSYCDLHSRWVQSWFSKLSFPTSLCSTGDCFKKPESYDCSWNGNTPNETFYILYGDDCNELETHMFMKACMEDEVIGGIVVGLALFGLFLSVSLPFKHSDYPLSAGPNCKNSEVATW